MLGQSCQLAIENLKSALHKKSRLFCASFLSTEFEGTSSQFNRDRDIGSWRQSLVFDLTTTVGHRAVVWDVVQVRIIRASAEQQQDASEQT